MKTGVELIAEERQEQITKHGRTAIEDDNLDDGQIVIAALYALGHEEPLRIYSGWDSFKEKVDQKAEIQKLVVAGALIAAEIDRLNRIQE